MTVKIPPQAIAMVKKWEGFRSTAYKDGGGVLTIGYGTTTAANVGIVVVPGMTISRSQAEKYLITALEKFARNILPAITEPMNANEWSATLSLSYNIGPGAYRSSTALRRFNAGDKRGAAEAMTWFDKDNGRTVRGLQRRRQDEKALFLTPVHMGFLERLVRWLQRMFKIATGETK